MEKVLVSLMIGCVDMCEFVCVRVKGGMFGRDCRVLEDGVGWEGLFWDGMGWVFVDWTLWDDGECVLQKHSG